MVKWSEQKREYRQYCSTNKKQTCIEKCGVDNPTKLAEITNMDKENINLTITVAC